MTWRPRCIMKPVIEPTLPIVMMVPPFWSMPERAPARPFTTRSPPRMAAPVCEPGVALDDRRRRTSCSRTPPSRPGR
jgi:hypothetical protein